MRKICDSSRYFTIVRLTSSALGRSWPIGFSTTTRVKFGASGVAIRPALISRSTESPIASGGIAR